MTGDEERFTLEEARLKLALQECAEYGHSWSVVTTRSLCDAFDTPVSVVCSRCQEAHAVEVKVART